MIWDQRSDYSWKEALLPVCQTLLYFTEDTVTEAQDPDRGKIVLLRSCDLAAVERFDYIFLQNGPEDSYYKAAGTRSNSSSWAVRSPLRLFLLLHGHQPCRWLGRGPEPAPEGYLAEARDGFLADALAKAGTPCGRWPRMRWKPTISPSPYRTI